MYTTNYLYNQENQYKAYETNRFTQQRYSNNFNGCEPRVLQETNQYTSRTNKSPDEVVFQRTKNRIEELQLIINEL